MLGFTEAEGCFTVSLLKNSKAFRTRFIISQKGDINLPVLSSFIILFNTGYIEGHHQKDNYSYVASGLNNVQKCYFYFDNYINFFMGIKRESYLKFKRINNMFINKEHLLEASRMKIALLVADVNSAYRKFK